MASFYFATNLMISYSVFSIKTAGVLWFMLGAMGRDRATVASKPTSVRLPALRPSMLASATANVATARSDRIAPGSTARSSG